MTEHTQHNSHSPVRDSEPDHAHHAGHSPEMHGGQHKQHHGHGPDDDHMVHSHGQHAGHSTAMFKDRFWLTLALSVPVVFFSPMFAHLLGYMPPEFPGSAWIPPALGTVIFFYGGMPFLKGGLSELKTRKPGMMLLIAMAISVAFIASWATSLRIGNFDLDFWWELALLVAIMLLGHWIEMRALGSAQGALDALAALLPDEAERVTPNGTETVPVTDLAPGDVVLVRSGARMPADGTIVEGQAEFDESMITGESKTVARGPGDPVVAGTVATDNTVRVRVTAVGEDTALAGIQRLVAEAQASSSKAQALADRAAAFLFYFATIAGVVTFIAWILLGSLPEAVTRTVTVLVIACPHALGLAIPLVIAISTEQAARVGVLIKNRMALERMRTVDVVLFDKTGTLTKGEPELKDITAVDGTTPRELLAVAAAVESDSEHPVARAIVRAAHHQGLDLPTATGFSSMTGRGVRAMIDGRTVQVGGPALLRELDLTETDAMAATTRQWAGRGAAVLHVVDGDRILGAVSLEDAIRPESRQAVKALQARGIKVALITGDARQVADAVGAELGIDEVFAEVLPADKDKKVAQLQARGLKVAMVGDGVNDSPALARAEVGIAIGAGTDVAMESAGVILAGNDPRAVLSMVDLSRASYTKMWQNLIWATGYNIIAVPLAAGVLAFAGVVLSPAAGAVLMSASTIVVALNAQLLRRVKLNPSQVR
ncbi:heavy metal translocating P-type ATPase [Arthrobacter sp. TES]|uniref:heavy metal translocating P-type ATPase n=1 Tax=Paenarthrobacter ureafaciens TaxID=37931 RepID=UPI00039839A6|nr:heavy metal translocating P-type ATPase [Arthrobacter sp. TES]GLU60079.1 copper-translocating P-type ATPase [Paenarthrobacter ureafaciens]GLU64505.1 copper-translocating P-type ATPase [Paenarthrobacter ureafaciens]GLU68623.1 copper-translocating P-type ATPase [Paenarthrobacter ureafaciens]GLU73042.1 copper-translocating P-type ATPase [Paenarthrobacter ureafaciens]